MKKFIALLLVVAFVCASTVGCGTPSTPAKPAGAGAGAGAGGTPEKPAKP